MPWVPALEVVNLDHPYKSLLPLGVRGGFSLYYEHSIYGSPVREHYILKGANLVLLAVETSDSGVAAYYGFDTQGPHYQVNVLFPEIVLRVRMSKGEQLILREGRELGIKDLGLPGDRILLRPVRCSVLEYLLESYSR